LPFQNYLKEASSVKVFKRNILLIQKKTT